MGDGRTARPGDCQGAPIDDAASSPKGAPSGPATDHVCSSPRRATDDAYYQPGDSDLYAVPASGGEITKIADIDGAIGSLRVSPDGRSIAFIGSLNGAPERSYSQSDLFIVPIGSEAKNLTAAYDFDIGGGIGGDQAAPRGGASRLPIWSADGSSIVVVGGEQGDANLVRIDVGQREDQSGFQRHPRGAVLYRRPGTAAPSPRSPRRRPTSATCSCVGSGAPRQVTTREREPVQQDQAQRTRRNLVDELRWQEDSRMDPPSAGLRSHQEVPVHSPDSWRTTLGLRQHVHARVPLDGREGLRRAVSQSSRQQQLRAGLRQRHSIPVSRRRLQGLDGGGRRSIEARLHRRETARRHGRQRRRVADQLDDHTDQSLRRRGVSAVDRGLVGLLVHRGLHALHADLVPQGAVGGSGRLRRALADHARREGQDAADAGRRRRRPADAGRRMAAR